jgi:prepilin-type N-terminal cleavage/methylation domain-containing protein
MRKGFTIVEMLTVVGIIAVLATIITTAASGAIKSGRDKRTDVMRTALSQAVGAYYAQECKWPSLIEQFVQSGGRGDSNDDNLKTFKDTQADQILREVVGKGFGKSGAKAMLIDASALFVCESSSANSSRAYGIDFTAATAKGAKRKIPLSQMAFGYQDRETGRFKRFKVIYKLNADSVSVEKQD